MNKKNNYSSGYLILSLVFIVFFLAVMIFCGFVASLVIDDLLIATLGTLP